MSDKAAAARRRRVDRGTKTEAEAAAFSAGSLQRMIQLPLLQALDEAGGAGRPRDIYDRIADDLGVDQDARSTDRRSSDGQVYNVFQQQVRWARQTAVAEGLIAGARGTWELTDAAYAKLGRIRRGAAVLIYSVGDGIALWAHAEDAAEHIGAGSVQLVLTSPPYPVVKRAYGRYSVPEWLHWMRRLMAIWKELISDDGTIAVNLMDVFVSGAPSLSPYVERFTLAAIDDVGLHLAGRMMWHSPNKLGNIQWHAKAKVTPRNSLEHILLFSKQPKPAWDITRMDPDQRPARSAARVAADAARKDAPRPAGYNISEAAMSRRAADRLPSNLIISGGAAGSGYAQRCRAAGIEPHPARFPEAVPRQIILLASGTGDTVYDPMAGSNTTGKVASELGRRFISSDPMLEYVRGSALRFDTRPDFRLAAS